MEIVRNHDASQRERRFRAHCKDLQKVSMNRQTKGLVRRPEISTLNDSQTFDLSGHERCSALFAL
jgi:hypothetical protein